MMEILYKKFYGIREKVLEYWGIYLVSVVMNYLGDRDVLNGSQTFWQKMTDLSNSAVFILLILTVLMIVYYVLLAISGYYTRKQEPVAAFTQLMREHSDEFAHPKISGGLVWGEDRTLWTAPNIVLGMKSENVRVTYFDPIPFEFVDNELKAEHMAFDNSESFQKTKELGNDLPRYMLTRYGANFNKENPILTLQLKQTSWSYCQFVWHRYQGQENERQKQCEWREKIVSEHVGNSLRVTNYPNSLCLHLIIETSNGKVLITMVSKEKSNDYPTTKAVSIGEQIELADFVDQHDFQKDFVKIWTQRAVCEEFGLSNSQFDEVFDEKSLRVLSLDLEMDIYNFALVCTIRMRHTCEQFKKIVNGTIEQKEISDIGELALSDIPGILLNHPANKNEYHPSSYMRLLMFYLYKNGYKRTCKRLFDEGRKTKDERR